MVYNITNMMLSLAHAMATPAGCAVGQDLFVHQSPSIAELYAVLKVWGGPVPNELNRVPAASIQCMISAMDAAQGLDLGFRLYESLHNSADVDARPRSAWSIPGKKLDAAGQLVADPAVSEWTIHGLALDAPPGAIGRDDAGRWEISFNFHVHFSAT
jgi:hypothetical protein